MQNIIDTFKYMDKKVLTGLLFFLILLIALPLILLEVKTQQEVRQRANSFDNNSIRVYPCGSNVVIRLKIDEDPSCPSGILGVTSFKSTASFSYDTNTLNKDYKIHWKWAKYFCPDNKATGTACLEPAANPSAEGTFTLAHGTEDSATATTGVMSPSQSNSAYTGQACGWYQNDLGFEVLNTDGSQVCDWHVHDDLGSSNANFSACQTQVVCKVINTPTPTPTTPVTTPTDSPTATPGVTVTDSPTETPGVTLTDTPTDSPTSGVSTTPTNTPPPGSTPTPTPTTPPGSTPTPTTPVISTPKPTLPPTGPGDTLFGVGLAGVAIALVGVIFVLAF